ncbi:MAG: LysR family transcriptional regulator [Gammaproteobacteria bacterium]
MRLTLDALAVLDAIDRRGSFAAAAEALHRVPSAVTYTLQKLEQDLDVVLFDRSGHRAKLTAAGEKLLRDGRHLLQAAGQLEAAVRRVAKGWETELKIAVDELIPLERLFPLLATFYQEDCGTALRLSSEMLSGTWDALLSGRADLVIGATGEGPAGGGYTSMPLGTMPFVFVVAPTHPLAALAEPLQEQDIQAHRVVAAADSSRTLPPLTSSILSGQDVLTVPTMASKCAAHRHGLGVGYVPRFMVSDDLARGRLIEKRTANPAPMPALQAIWRNQDIGKALHWFLEQLARPELFADILTPMPTRADTALAHGNAPPMRPAR